MVEEVHDETSNVDQSTAVPKATAPGRLSFTLSQQPSGNPLPIKRQLTGIRPKVALRKRGMSFKEVTKLEITTDEDGVEHLNQYKMLDVLGKGAYGTVFKVESTKTGEFLAAKAVDKKALKRVRVGRFGNALQNVKKELNIWKKLNHRHIVLLREIIDSEDCNTLYMISELVDGGTVLDDNVHCTPLDPSLTKLYFCELIEGVDFLHENKIIHRDIKPGNLLLKRMEDNAHVLKIADFGVSHEIEGDDDSMRQTTGTAIFNAPEMLTGETFHGKPIDIWACGVTLYMFVYGHPPFEAQTMTDLYSRIQNDPIVYAEAVNDVPVDKDLIDLLKHILEKDPEKRYTTAQIRTHSWASTEFQTTAMKCVTHTDGRRKSSFAGGLSSILSVGKSIKDLFSRSPSTVFPTLSPNTSGTKLDAEDELAQNSQDKTIQDEGSN